MTTRLPSLHGRLTTFASGPWESDDHDGPLPAVAAALASGADGIRATVHRTRDGVPVIADAPTVGSRFRRRRIRDLDDSDLGPGCVDLSTFLDVGSNRIPLWLDIDDESTFEAILAAVSDRGDQAESNLWLVHPEQRNLIRWRPATTARLILAMKPPRPNAGLERRFAELHAGDIDGAALGHRHWSGGTIALAHRFGLLAVGSGAEHERELAAMVDGGIDAVSAADTSRMTAVAGEYYR